MRFAVVLVAVLACSTASGQTLELVPRDLAKQRREYDAIRNAELAGPLRGDIWAAQELKKGLVVTKIVTKPANAPAVWLGDSFAELTDYQRDALMSYIQKMRFKTNIKKPLPISLYETKSDGTQGKKVGTYNNSVIKLTGKFKSPPIEQHDNEEDIFPLDKAAK